MTETDRFFRSAHFSHLTLRVADLERVARFYEDQLGLARLSGTTRRVELAPPESDEPLIVLDSAPGAPSRPRGSAGLFHVALLYPDRASLGGIFGRLVESGMRLGASDHGVSEALYLSDPEGNGLELYADRPRSEWPGEVNGQVAMFTDALDADSLLAAGRDASDPRMPPGTRIGHIHLSVSDLDRAARFYETALGFPLRQGTYPGARFFGRDGYHHHIGANTWQSSRPAPAGALGLARVTLHLPSEQERDDVFARAAEFAPAQVSGAVVLRNDDDLEMEIQP